MIRSILRSDKRAIIALSKNSQFGIAYSKSFNLQLSSQVVFPATDQVWGSSVLKAELRMDKSARSA